MPNKNFRNQSYQDAVNPSPEVHPTLIVSEKENGDSSINQIDVLAQTLSFYTT